MTTKHPERRPVDDVEDVIRVDIDSPQRMYIRPDSGNALFPLIQVLAKTAERARQKRNDRVADEQGAA